MRRVFALLCVALLVCAALPLGGCVPGDAAVAYAPDKYAEAFAANWRYGMLEPHLQACYGALYTAVTDTLETDSAALVEGGSHNGVAIRLPAALRGEEEARQLFDAFLADNPQFFFVSNTFTYSGAADAYTGFTLLYLMDADARVAAVAQLEAAVQPLVAACAAQEPYAQELYLHDALAAVCTYDHATAAAPKEGDPLAFTAYGALVRGTAVCEGYSRAMQLLLARVGIASTLVTGIAPDTGVSHMWNMVRIDGACYHLDVTWDDSGDTLHYRYFNLTDDRIALSRSVQQSDLPACTAVEANYFRRNGRYIDTFDREVIAGVIAEAVRRGDRAVELSFAPDKFANGALLLSNTPQLAGMVQRLLPDGMEFAEYSLAGSPEEYILTVLL